MSYTKDRDGYAIEATEGTSVITAAGDATYLLGLMASKQEWPSPEMRVRDFGVGVGDVEAAAGNVWIDNAECRGMLGLILQNGIPLWYALGAASTGAGPPYTHTITPQQTLPTLTWQHEESGAGTTRQYQFPGCKVDSLVLTHDLAAPPPQNVLMGKIEFMSYKPTKPGFSSTNDPALPATATTGPYITLTRTYDYGGTPVALDGLQKVDITIANGVTPLYGSRWDTGVYAGEWPYKLLENRMKEYQVDLAFHPSTIEQTMWDDLVARTTTKDLYFKWTKSANDYIAVTLADCAIISHTITSDPQALKVVHAKLKPRAVTVSVVDAIAGGAYGE